MPGWAEIVSAILVKRSGDALLTDPLSIIGFTTGEGVALAFHAPADAGAIGGAVAAGFAYCIPAVGAGATDEGTAVVIDFAITVDTGVTAGAAAVSP